MTDKIKAREQPIEEDQKEAVAFVWINEYQQHYFNTKYPKGLESFADFIIPTDYNEQVSKAKELRDIGLVDRLLRIRQNYTLPIKGFKFKGKNTKRQQIFYNEYVLPLIQSFSRQWVYEYNSISEVFANYGFKSDGKTPGYLRTENAEQITPIDIFGKEMYEVKISSQLKKQIQKLKNTIDDKYRSAEERQTAREILAALPEYLRKVIDSNGIVNNTIILSQENMYRSTDQKPDYKLRPKPGLLRIAKQLMLREFLADLDFVNAFGSQKTSFTHVKGGTKEKPWPAERIEKLHRLITEGPPGDKIVTTPGDCEIVRVDNKVTELLDPKKYERCNKDILDFFGISITFVPSEASNVNNQTVVVSVKPFIQEILAQRKEFAKFFKTYCEVINKVNGFSETPELLYERINLYDEANLFKELQFLADRGVLSFEKVCLEFDLDYEEVMREKENDWKNRDIQAPVIELSQGTSPMLTKKFEQELKLRQISKSNNQNNSQSLDDVDVKE